MSLIREKIDAYLLGHKLEVRLGLIFYTIWLVLSGLALTQHIGGKGPFVAFCMAFGFMWALAWIGAKSYFYIFLSTFWLFGFWMKTVIHLLIGYPFVEPVGLFSFSPDAWSAALGVSTVAAIGLAFARLASLLFCGKSTSDAGKLIEAKVPRWYISYYTAVWVFTIFLIIGVPLFNSYFGLNQSGIIPVNRFPFKINAITAWLLYTGLAFWVSTILWWDVCLGRKILPRVFLPIFEAATTSISLLSRGAFIFHTIPYFIAGYYYRKELKLTNIVVALYFVAFILGFYCVVHSVTDKRAIMYSTVSSVAPAQKQDSGRFYEVASLIVHLTADRWIGVEGVMAVSAWPGVGKDLFMSGWREKSSYGKKFVFETIASSIYIDKDYPSAGKFNFASVPGIVAMLYYSGSKAFVFLAIFFICLVVLFSEKYAESLLGSPFMLSFYGAMLAALISQFGNLRLVLVQCFEIWAGLYFLYLLQSKGDTFLKYILKKRNKTVLSNKL